MNSEAAEIAVPPCSPENAKTKTHPDLLVILRRLRGRDTFLSIPKVSRRKMEEIRRKREFTTRIFLTTTLRIGGGARPAMFRGDGLLRRKRPGWGRTRRGQNSAGTKLRLAREEDFKLVSQIQAGAFDVGPRKRRINFTKPKVWRVAPWPEPRSRPDVCSQSGALAFQNELPGCQHVENFSRAEGEGKACAADLAPVNWLADSRRRLRSLEKTLWKGIGKDAGFLRRIDQFEALGEEGPRQDQNDGRNGFPRVDPGVARREGWSSRGVSPQGPPSPRTGPLRRGGIQESAGSLHGQCHRVSPT